MTKCFYIYKVNVNLISYYYWSLSLICHVSKQLSQNPIYVSILCMHSVHSNKALEFLFNLNPTHTCFFCHPISLILLVVLALSFHLPSKENRLWTIKYRVLGF